MRYSVIGANMNAGTTISSLHISEVDLQVVIFRVHVVINRKLLSFSRLFPDGETRSLHIAKITDVYFRFESISDLCTYLPD